MVYACPVSSVERAIDLHSMGRGFDSLAGHYLYLITNQKLC